MRQYYEIWCSFSIDRVFWVVTLCGSIASVMYIVSHHILRGGIFCVTKFFAFIATVYTSVIQWQFHRSCMLNKNAVPSCEHCKSYSLQLSTSCILAPDAKVVETILQHFTQLLCSPKMQYFN